MADNDDIVTNITNSDADTDGQDNGWASSALTPDAQADTSGHGARVADADVAGKSGLDNGGQSDTVSRIGVSEKKHGLTRTGLNGGILTPFDSERARAASRARWEKANAAIRRGIARAGEQLPGIQARDSFRVVEVLAEQHALHSYDPSARGSTGSFKMLLDRGFPAPDKSADGASPAPAADPDLRELLDAFRAWKSARGVVVDNDE